MRKKSFNVWFMVAALMMTACSENDDNVQAEGTSRMEFAIDFSEIVKSRAATSAIPETSWDKSIKEIQFFLYDVGGEVKYSARVDPAPNATKTFVYTDVPVGDYTLVAVANVHSSTNTITTNVPSLGAVEWNSSNVRQKAVSGLTISHLAGSFPTYGTANMVPTTLTAYENPSEIFMAEHPATVTIASGVKTDLTTSPLLLKREVSLMRVRLNVEDPAPGTDNFNSVDWTSDVSVIIYNLPQNMGIAAGNAGGTSSTSVGTNVQIGATAFNTADPTLGYSPGTMISGKFKKWADIVVFPNNGGRINNKTNPTDADKADVSQKYTIIVTAKGRTGHKLANGNILPFDQTIYWDGLIDHAFFPNFIREVNLTLKSGGKAGPLPPGPVEKGELEITVSAPEPWDSNILSTSIDM